MSGAASSRSPGKAMLPLPHRHSCALPHSTGSKRPSGARTPSNDVPYGERRSTGEQKYYVSNLSADTSLKMLAATIKARWVCEQAHQQLKEELGLDHFEGRSWTGLHRHALMT